MAARSFEVWHGSAELDGTMRWHAKKRKPTKSFNHGAGSLLFLLALASPVYVRKLFSLPLLFFLLLSRLYPFLPFYF